MAWQAASGPAAGLEVCAGCAGAVSVFACKECGSEEHPYSYSRCARCYVRELATEILTDPTTGAIHHRLTPVFDLLIASRRPQTTYTWLTRSGTVAPDILSAIASGRLPISHDAFRDQFPMDRRHVYLRDLLTSTGVLPPYSPRSNASDRGWPTSSLPIAPRMPRYSTDSPAGTSCAACVSTPPTAP